MATDLSAVLECCIHALVNAQLHIEQRRWMGNCQGAPGSTTRRAFSLPRGATARDVIAAAARNNMASMSNGALMRIAPLAIFGCYAPVCTLTAMAEQDARLSHPNRVCQSCNAAYIAALGHLISHPGDQQGAVKVATAVASGPDFNADVREWLLKDSLNDSAGLTCKQYDIAGCCRWGFTLAFMLLRKGSR